MTHRLAFGMAVLFLLCAAAAPARELPPLVGTGGDEQCGLCGDRRGDCRYDCDRCSAIRVEVDVRGGAARAEANDAHFDAVDAAKGLANLPARAAGAVPGIVRLVRQSATGHAAWGWMKQSLITPLVRLHTSQRERTGGAQGVEVETAQSVAGEATGRSPGATGWAVRAPEHLLVIEYRFGERAAEMPTLAINRGFRSGNEDPEVAVFASPVSVPGTDDEVPGLSPTDAGDGMEITAFRTEGSGVGFLVRISGLVILHADDRDA